MTRYLPGHFSWGAWVTGLRLGICAWLGVSRDGLDPSYGPALTAKVVTLELPVTILRFLRPDHPESL
jgi:hypothetical protein